ncbi:hypothetical protein Aduo_010304 [Ancylostoma duodenale]
MDLARMDLTVYVIHLDMARLQLGLRIVDMDIARMELGVRIVDCIARMDMDIDMDEKYCEKELHRGKKIFP